MNLTPQVYIISDLHLGHANIIKYCGRPEENNELIIKNWNQIVGKKDKVLCLGDLTLANKEKSVTMCKQLKGKKYLIRGNHDGHSIGWYKDCGFDVLEPIYKVFHNKYDQRYHVLFTHEPVLDIKWNKNWFNIHGHIHRGVHREFDLTERHFNASVEPLDYKPKPLYEILTYFESILKNAGNRKIV